MRLSDLLWIPLLLAIAAATAYLGECRHKAQKPDVQAECSKRP